MKLSFCIITVGKKIEELDLCLKSIHKNFANSNYEYEIIIVGNNFPNIDYSNCKLIEDNDYIEYLGKRKNIATENSSGDILIHCDDDIFFVPNWLENFIKYNSVNPDWEILGNKILLPDGNRYWDRAIYEPYQQMVDYDFESDKCLFYQCGCFSICKKSLLDKIKWAENIPFYGMFKGFEYNEDIEFSIRLKKNNVKIWFDKNNLVWHNDFSYLSDNITCNKSHFKKFEEKCISYILTINSILNNK